jgi:hypothetical protein
MTKKEILEDVAWGLFCGLICLIWLLLAVKGTGV